MGNCIIGGRDIEDWSLIKDMLIVPTCRTKTWSGAGNTDWEAEVYDAMAEAQRRSNKIGSKSNSRAHNRLESLTHTASVTSDGTPHFQSEMVIHLTKRSSDIYNSMNHIT